MQSNGVATAALLCVLWPAVPIGAQTTDLHAVHQQIIDQEDVLGRAMIDDHIVECADSEWSPLFEKFAGATAKRLGVADFAISTLPSDETIALADGTASPFALRRYDTHGSGDLFGVYRLLRDMALLKEHALDFDSLRIKAEPDDKVSFRARVSRVCLRESGKTANAGRSALEMERAELTFLQSANASIAQVAGRMRGVQVTGALGQLVDDLGGRPVSVSDLDYTGGTLTLHGVAAGASARAAIATSLRNAGLEAEKIEQPPLPCAAFTVVARLGNGSTAKPDAAQALFDDRTAAAICNPRLPAPVHVTAHGTGDLTLHARGVDMPAFFRVLDDLVPSDEGFVVEPGITRTVDVDIDDATSDEILAALRTAHAVDVGPGPLHRVCATACTPAPKQDWGGDAISLQLRNAEPLYAFRTFAEMAGLSIDVPPDLSGKFSLFTQKLPWDEVLTGIIDALHFDHTIDKETHRLYVGRPSDLAKPNHAGTIDVGKVHAPAWRRVISELKAENLAAGDIRLAAVARGGGVWHAYAVAPGEDPAPVTIDAGTKLFDATVESVSARNVTFRTASGREVVLDLPSASNALH